MASDRQIAANRRNATRSTGPRTKEGKARSALNSMKHGGYAQTLDHRPEQESYRAAAEEFVSLFAPANERVADMARNLFVKFERLTRVQDVEQASAYDSQRTAEARFLLERSEALEAADEALADRPFASFLTLSATVNGCERLSTRAEELRRDLNDGRWTDRSCRILLGLLGRHAEAARGELLEATRIVIDGQKTKRDASHAPEDSPFAEASDLIAEALDVVTEALAKAKVDLADEEEIALDLYVRKAGLDLSPQGRSINRCLIHASNDYYRVFRDLTRLTKADLNTELETGEDEPASAPAPRPEPARVEKPSRPSTPAVPKPPAAVAKPPARNEPMEEVDENDLRSVLAFWNTQFESIGLPPLSIPAQWPDELEPSQS